MIEQAHGIFKQIDTAHEAGNSVDILGKFVHVVDYHYKEEFQRRTGFEVKSTHFFSASSSDLGFEEPILESGAYKLFSLEQWENKWWFLNNVFVYSQDEFELVYVIHLWIHVDFD